MILAFIWVLLSPQKIQQESFQFYFGKDLYAKGTDCTSHNVACITLTN